MVKDFKSMTKKELVAYLELREELPQANSGERIADYLIKKYGKKQHYWYDGVKRVISNNVFVWKGYFKEGKNEI